MLRIKHKSVSIQSIALVTLCLCCGLTMYLSLTPADAAERREQPYYVVDDYQKPAIVYRIVNREPSTFFRRRLGGISSIALWDEKLYFCSPSDKRIYVRMGQRERVVYEHWTYIRDIGVDTNDNLYLSEASGKGGDGRIYQLTPSINHVGDGVFSLQSKEPICTVHLKTVDEYWMGDFTFDRWNNLYLTRGGHPGYIYRVPREGSGYGSPRRIYSDMKGTIKGIAIISSEPNFVYYADGRQTIYRLDIRNLRRSVEFTGNIARSRNPQLSDIAFDISIQN